MPGLALGHSAVVSTTPSRGSTVQSLPAAIGITFTAPIGRVVFVTATDAAGRNHAVSARPDASNAARVRVRTRDPRPGRYRVSWKIVATDGHAQAGTFTFTVGPGK